MVVPGNIGSSNTSSVGGDLVKSLLDSATLSRGESSEAAICRHTTAKKPAVKDS